jgi:hypothetical protein
MVIGRLKGVRGLVLTDINDKTGTSEMFRVELVTLVAVMVIWPGTVPLGGSMPTAPRYHLPSWIRIMDKPSWY